MLTRLPACDSVPRLSEKGGVLPDIEMSYPSDISQVGLEKAGVTFYVARNRCEKTKAGFMAVRLWGVSYPELSPFLPALILNRYSYDAWRISCCMLAKISSAQKLTRL